MVNNKFIGAAQIPVEIDGKTYYGCCEACKNRLINEPDTRFGKDPVTGEEVDKAVAVIGKTPGGDVFYFENAENLAKFAAHPAEFKAEAAESESAE